MTKENKYIINVYLKYDFNEEPISFTVNSLEEIKKLPFYNKDYINFTIFETNPPKTRGELIREKLIEKLFNATSICKSYRSIYKYKKVTTEDMIYMYGEEYVKKYNYIKRTIRNYLKAIDYAYKIEENYRKEKEVILLKDKFRYAYHFNEIFRLYEEALHKNIFKNDEIFNYVYMNFPMGAYAPHKGAFNFVSYMQETIEEFDPSIKIYIEEFETFKEEQHKKLQETHTLKKTLK